jgi:low affinity Fe/Cu permease
MTSDRATSNPVTRFQHRKEALLILLILIAVFGLLFYGNPTFLPFKSFTETDVLAIVTSLFVVAVFMERSVEAILIPVRTPDRKKREQKLEVVRREAETDDSKKVELLKLEQDLENYKMVTAQRALWISFVFGLLISLVGVRTLAGLVEPDSLKTLGDMHRSLFAFVDIVLTGGVIAGGSAAIDKIGRKISKYFKLSSVTDSNTPDADTTSQGKQDQ